MLSILAKKCRSTCKISSNQLVCPRTSRSLLFKELIANESEFRYSDSFFGGSVKLIPIRFKPKSAT